MRLIEPTQDEVFDGKSKIYPNNVFDEEFRRHFDYIVENKAKPKKTTLGWIRDNIGFFENQYKLKQLDEYVQYMIKDVESGITPISEMDPKEKNWSFHSCKVQWLMMQERTQGLYSTIQCTVSNKGLFFHPGMSRIYALMQMEKWDAPVVMWDTGNLDQSILSYDEWMDIFDVGKDRFGTAHEYIIEMHVGERRDLIQQAELDIKRDLYRHKKPQLKGETSPELEEYFREYDDSEGVIVETKGDYKFQKSDFRKLTELYIDVREEYQDEKIQLRVKRQ